MELTEIAKAVAMYNMLYEAAPITEEQAHHFIKIWDMVASKPETPPPSIKKEQTVFEEPPQPIISLPPNPKVIPTPPVISFGDMLSEPLCGEFLPAGEAPYKSSAANWPQGAKYRISVAPRREVGGAGYFLYFRGKPPQEAFDTEYTLFLDRTHHVHVHHRMWHEDWNNWQTITITDEYCAWRHKNAGCLGDSFDTNPEWGEMEARFRIKYKNSGQFNNKDFRYVYFLNHPSEQLLAEYERRHHVVLLEKRDNLIGAKNAA